MRKIMILGFSGCGKSTLARNLGDILGIAPTHMDSLFWLPGWQEETDENFRKKLADVLKRDSWIIEGSYRRIFWQERLRDADTVIFLDFNRFLCLYHVIKRRIIYNGKTRPDMGKDCCERLDLEFVRWVLFDGRKHRKNDLAALQGVKGKVYIFKHQHELKKFLSDISKGRIK